MIRMRHPLHGEMHVYLEAEAASNAANGWERMSEPGAEPAPVVEAAPVVIEVEPRGENLSLAEQYEVKFGKLPHHRMKPETIKKALEE